MRTITSWDLFCRVVDNYGDIGVCWRLARQLVQEHGHTVRLWVDDLRSFEKLCPAVDVAADAQRVSGVDIRRWGDDAQVAALLAADAHPAPHDVVIEAFACAAPEAMLKLMADQATNGTAPVWINLEYLSAENWVAEYHAMQSPHPRLPLVKHFFFPGFARNTGGVLHESHLGAQRSMFNASPTAHQALWHRLSVDDLMRANPRALRVSLFAYANAALPTLVSQWEAAPQQVICLVPEGLAATQIAELLGDAGAAKTGARWTRGQLTVAVVPFVPQEHYDPLLWACDINFVRGEDSFVRAQWALRPFVWHIYPQSDDVHLTKLDAFLARYTPALPQADADALTTFWHAWNGKPETLDWPALVAAAPALRTRAITWEHTLLHLGDLTANLVAFCEKQVK
ncbi:elongation factor P maturation arginine rhamnosyltransferase EarP [Ralstonia sp. UBA689]|uniref:elongation factor P maturation arginine rhamnosyltransferase EarP n=1 Tax=Ralstonia sp. UBA689 TaxID=1947373 RepID=UPI0025CDD225|nr:elongation factor P maturation arginine rhamnosyltransferase EarP [Ralstonia sp. UBA689]